MDCQRALQLLMRPVDAGDAELREEPQCQQRLVHVVVFPRLIHHQHQRVGDVAECERRERDLLEGVVGANGFRERGAGVLGGHVEGRGLKVVVDVVGGYAHEGGNFIDVRSVR